MKKAKNFVMYAVCIGVILYLAYCVAAMSTSGLAKTADTYFGDRKSTRLNSSHA